MKWLLYLLFAGDLLICIGLLVAKMLGADAPTEAFRHNSMRMLIEVSAMAVIAEVRRG